MLWISWTTHSLLAWHVLIPVFCAVWASKMIKGYLWGQVTIMVLQASIWAGVSWVFIGTGCHQAIFFQCCFTEGQEHYIMSHNHCLLLITGFLAWHQTDESQSEHAVLYGEEQTQLLDIRMPASLHAMINSPYVLFKQQAWGVSVNQVHPTSVTCLKRKASCSGPRDLETQISWSPSIHR